jgi:hypothetical protein
LGRNHDAETNDVNRRTSHHRDAQTEAVCDRTDQSLGEAPDNVLDRQGQRKIGRRDGKIVRDRH